MTVWRWRDPKGRTGYREATREAAMANAVHCALVDDGAKARDIADALVPGLWRSIEAQGWSLEEVQP